VRQRGNVSLRHVAKETPPQRAVGEHRNGRVEVGRNGERVKVQIGEPRAAQQQVDGGADPRQLGASAGAHASAARTPPAPQRGMPAAASAGPRVGGHQRELRSGAEPGGRERGAARHRLGSGSVQPRNGAARAMSRPACNSPTVGGGEDWHRARPRGVCATTTKGFDSTGPGQGIECDAATAECQARHSLRVTTSADALGVQKGTGTNMTRTNRCGPDARRGFCAFAQRVRAPVPANASMPGARTAAGMVGRRRSPSLAACGEPGQTGRTRPQRGHRASHAAAIESAGAVPSRSTPATAAVTVETLRPRAPRAPGMRSAVAA